MPQPYRNCSRILCLAIAFALSLPAAGWAGAGLWQSGGPLGGKRWVNVVGVDRASPATLYGLSNGGLVKSADSGRSWFAASRGLLADPIAVAADPGNPETLYAATYGGIFRSLDAGRSWVGVHPVGAGYCATGSARAVVAIDPVTPTTVYVGLCGGGLFRSTDSGASWADAGHGFGNSDQSVTSVALDPTTPSTIYVGTVFGIYKTNDAGDTWARVSTAGYTQAVVLDPTNPSTVYATAWPGVVIKSINGGATWATMNHSFANHDISSLVMDPGDAATTLYLGARDAGVFKSTVSGEAWVQVTQGLTDLAVSALIAPAPRSLYASTAVGAFQSQDAGASWAPLPGPAGVAVLPIATNSATVFAGTLDDGVYRSTDRGGTWTQANTGLTQATYDAGITVRALVIDPTTPTTVYAAAHAGVFKSTDSGSTWVAANRGLESSGYPFSLVIDPQNPSTLYVGNLDGVARSTDGGMSWAFVYRPPQVPPFYGVSVLAVDPLTPGKLYAIMNGQVFKSTDAGATWVAAAAGLPVGSAIAVAINPLAPATLYAATGDTGVFKSTDSGGTWAPANTGLTALTVFCLAVDPASPTTLYAGTWLGGVFRSTDGGATWADFNKGLTNQRVSSLAFDAAGATTLYAGIRNDGVWQFRPSTGAFHTVAPCRAIDTRLADGPALAAGASRAFKMVGKCGIPAEAGSVSVNVTATAATSPGHLRIHPGNVALLSNSSLNFAAGQTRANNAVSLLGAAGDIAVFSGQGNGSVQVIVDVNGYFE